MRTKSSVLATAILTALAYGGIPAASPSGESEAREVRFFVYYHNVNGYVVGYKGVQCLLLTAAGEVPCGKTGEDGELIVPSATLFQPKNLAALFCPSDGARTCTALRLNRPGSRDVRELDVRLEMPEVIDRSKAGASAR